jgi:nicotinate-nucleotide--dimethylbenzimidazole phosphoribosyltransferase
LPHLESTLQRIREIDRSWIVRAQQRQDRLTKPPGSLGRLEWIAARLCAIQETLQPCADTPRIVTFAGDHGVCDEGVSPYPQAVTGQMVLNFLAGGAAINALTRAAGASLRVVDVGVASELPEASGLVNRRVRNGTRNFCLEPAMTIEEAHQALDAGIDMAAEAARDGCRIAGYGEMGIGNTTSASAIAAALTGLSAELVVGRGTGAPDEMLVRKTAVIRRACDLHRAHLDDPFEALRRVGGLEIAAMTGFCLGCAVHRIPVLVDGFISSAAAAVAVKMCPALRDYLIASHRSVEPGHGPLLDFIGGVPLIDMHMRLGEGTGAAIAIPLIRAAVAAHNEMATLESAGVSDKS